jgi:hypothetical protein
VDERRRTQLGIVGLIAGVAAVIGGSLWAHFTGLPEINSFGVEIYPAIPRGWQWQLAGQIVALGGAQIGIAAIAFGFLYDRPLTWARASIGAFLFTAEMMIVFGIIPNQWLTLTQATLEWTPQKIALTLPAWLTLNNEVSISYAALKDVVSGSYMIGALGAVAVVMYQWQERSRRAVAAPPPQPVSSYGRPMLKGGGR